MQQVKIFKGIESEVATLENEINTWIRENGVTLLSLSGNIAPQSQMHQQAGAGGMDRISYPPSDIVVILVYDK